MKEERIFRGIGVSPGTIHGQALKLHSHNRFVFKIYVDDSHLDEEVLRLEEAIRRSREQLRDLKTRLAQKIAHEHSFILEAHLLMLEDQSLISDIVSTIRDKHANAEWSVLQATGHIRKALASLHDEYLRERAGDIDNVVERILVNLSGSEHIQWSHQAHNLIVISENFSPSSFAVVDLERVRGLALESGGRTSHTAIISRSLRIPAVMGLQGFLSNVTSGDSILLDGDEGLLIRNPTTERLEGVRERLARFEAAGKGVPLFSGRPATAAHGGIAVSLRANTDLPHEVVAAKVCGAEGIGLFRTDFYLIAQASTPPDVRTQEETYAMLAREMSPHPVAVRTLDTGMDSSVSGREYPTRENANMGLRGIRRSLVERDQFCTQVEAILRAGRLGRMEIVLPMVTSVDEVRQARALIREVRNRVSDPGGSHPVPVGVMIEVPAAVMALDTLAREVDFLCVGTNDLIQYLLAVDRGIPEVSHLFQPLHPAVLASLKRIVEVAQTQGIPARVCGEMSANPYFAVLLTGMGFTEFSMNAFSIPTIRETLQELAPDRGREIARRALGLASAQEVGEYLLESVNRALPFELSNYAKEVLMPSAAPSHTND